MPSDAKKREQQRKKDAAKARQGGKKNEKSKAEEQNDVLKTNGVNGVNGDENGSTDLSAEGKTFFSFLMVMIWLSIFDFCRSTMR